MKKSLVLQILLFLHFLGTCQNLNLNDYYGYYIGISNQDIKSQYDLKYYMLLTLQKGFCGINFNQPGEEKWMRMSDDIIAPHWAYQCSVIAIPDNQFKIESKSFFFSLKSIDSLRLKIENSTFTQYIGDTIYRITARKYKDDELYYSWSYFPVFVTSLGENIWRLNDKIMYPDKPVWYFINFITDYRTILPDSLFSHPLTKKIKNRLAN